MTTTQPVTSTPLTQEETLATLGKPEMKLGETGLHFFESGEAWWAALSGFLDLLPAE